MTSGSNTRAHGIGWQRGVAASLLVATLAAATPAGRALGGGPSSASISTQGVVVFGVGVTDSTRGTYAMNPDGSGLRKLTSQIYAMDVSRGRVPVTVLVNGPAAAAQDIYALRTDGTGSATLLVSGSALNARFSPDGQRIAFVSVAAGPIWSIQTGDVVRDGTTGDVTGLSNVATAWTGTWQVSGGIDFSRDGTKLVCAMNAGAGYDLYVLRLSDGSLEQITSTPEFELQPRWSPVDDRIAFLRRADPATNLCSLLTIDYSTRTTKTILAAGSSQYAAAVGGGVAWSSGGTNLLTLVGAQNKPSDLYQFPSTGGKGVNVTGGINLYPGNCCWGW